MPNDDTVDRNQIERKIRDSSVLFALQQLYNDIGKKVPFRYIFDDIPSQGIYHQMAYWINDPETRLLIGAGIVAAGTEMKHHLIHTTLPIESRAVFFTEDHFTKNNKGDYRHVFTVDSFYCIVLTYGIPNENKQVCSEQRMGFTA
jgi:hypothetical protein